MPGKSEQKKATSKRMPMMGFRCPPDLREIIKQRAIEEDRSEASVILRALRAQLQGRKTKQGE